MSAPMKKLSKTTSTNYRKHDTPQLLKDAEALPLVSTNGIDGATMSLSPKGSSFLAFEMLPGNEDSEGLINGQSSTAQPKQSHGHGHGEKCGVWKTLANIFISFVGAGILTLPHAFAKSGLLLGGVFLIFLALLTFYCILLLLDCKKALEHKGAVTYADVAEHALGAAGKTVVEVLLVVSQTGFCVAYIIFIHDTLPHVIPAVSTWVVMAVIVPVQVALAMLRDLSALAPCSLLADCAHVIGMVVVLKDDVEHFNIAHETLVLSKGAAALPFLFGVSIYCYEGISMILPLEESMADRSKFRGTLTTGFTSITLIFLVFGAVGYSAYGETTMDKITDNLPDDWSTTSVKVALCWALFFTFPIMMLPAYEVLERALENATWFDRRVAPGRRFAFVPLLSWWMIMKGMRTAIVCFIAWVAVSVPGFGGFIGFIGSFCGAALAFILPSTCHLVLFNGNMSRIQQALDYFMIAFGFTGMVFGVAESLKMMMLNDSEAA